MLNQNNYVIIYVLEKRLLLIFCFTPFLVFFGEPYNNEYCVLSYIFL